MIKELVLVSAAYPTKDDPVYTFIRPVACGLADLGIHVTVLSPQSISNAIKRKVRIRPYHWIDYSEKGNGVEVYQPKHISLSMLKYKGQLISQILFERALRRSYNGLKIKPDIVYAHFWESVVAAVYALKEECLPIIAVSGEEHVSVFETYSRQRVKNTVKKVNGMICVSTKNLNECRSLDLVHDKMKTTVLPNSIDTKVFHKMNRKKIREKLGWPEETKIAVYVGEFSMRKGVNRVIEAAKSIPQLKLVLIGWGDPLIESDQILFAGKLAHNIIPVYLNAADFFVLPTLAEGCCNAIVEALACGLPIVSSDRAFNYDILNKDNSILVDPEDTQELATAMGLLIDSPILLKKLSSGAIEKAQELDISVRVKRIKDFLEEVIVCK